LAASVYSAVTSGSLAETEAWPGFEVAYVGYAELEHYFDRLQQDDPLTLWREASE
jgi:hypothetical protein